MKILLKLSRSWKVILSSFLFERYALLTYKKTSLQPMRMAKARYLIQIVYPQPCKTLDPPLYMTDSSIIPMFWLFISFNSTKMLISCQHVTRVSAHTLLIKLFTSIFPAWQTNHPLMIAKSLVTRNDSPLENLNGNDSWYLPPFWEYWSSITCK